MEGFDVDRQNGTQEEVDHFISVLPDITILGLLAVFGMLMNGSLLVYNILVKSTDKVLVLEIYILLSAAADFVISIYYLPFQVSVFFLTRNYFSQAFCDVHILVLTICVAVSQCGNLLLAVYCFIKCRIDPHYYLSRKRAVGLSVISVLVVSTLLTVPVVLGYIDSSLTEPTFYFCQFNDHPNFMVYVIVSMFPAIYFPAIISLALHIALACKGYSNSQTQVARRNTKMAKAVLGIFLLFLLCILPPILLRLVDLGVSIAESWATYVGYIFFFRIVISPCYFCFRINSIVPAGVKKLIQRSQVHPGVDTPAT